MRRRSLDRLRGCGRGAGGLDRGPMRDVAIEGGGELRLVVGVDLGVVPPPRNRHVRQAPVHELFSGSLHVDVYQYAVGLCPRIQRDSLESMVSRVGVELSRTHNLQIKSGPRAAIATRHTRNGGHVERPSVFDLRSREHPGTEAEPKMVRICPLKSVARGVLR